MIDPARINILIPIDPHPFFDLVFRSLASNNLKAEGGKAIAKALADPNCKVEKIE